jgi:hypothetical protein
MHFRAFELVGYATLGFLLLPMVVYIVRGLTPPWLVSLTSFGGIVAVCFMEAAASTGSDRLEWAWLCILAMFWVWQIFKNQNRRKRRRKAITAKGRVLIAKLKAALKPAPKRPPLARPRLAPQRG